MIPSTGWLPVPLETGLPLDMLLPVPHTGKYKEGGTVFKGVTAIGFKQIHALFVLSTVTGRFGYGETLHRMLEITLSQGSVFGVMLLDSFTPPEIAHELFDFDAYTQLACLSGLFGVDVAVAEQDGEPVAHSPCPSGAVVTFED